MTNDDGIASGFLHALVGSLLDAFEVRVVAPAEEQSWIGRAVSRRGEILVEEAPDFPLPCPAWRVHGTPTDCVNLALGNLLEKRPDIVVSGINLGYNTTETLILSSGTVAGAIEGALWGLPAVAFSKVIPSHAFDGLHRANGRASGAFAESLETAATHARRMALEILERPTPGCVVNINFPAATRADSPVEETRLARVFLGSLYRQVAPGRYIFAYTEGQVLEEDPQSDRACLARGAISRSCLDFRRIGTLPAVPVAG